MSIPFKSQGEIHTALRQALGTQPRDGLWRQLNDEGSVDKVMQGRQSLEGLVTRYCQLEDYQLDDRSAEPVRMFSELPPSSQLGDISYYTAEVVGTSEAVLAYRQEHLDGQLLDRREVRNWIRQREPAPEEETRWGTFAIGENTPQGWLASPGANSRRASTNRLPYDATFTNPSTGELMYMPKAWARTAAGGPLSKLRDLVSELSEVTGWNEHETTTFVLTGRVPMLRQLQARTTEYKIASPVGEVTIDRIHLDVHPSTSPAEVVKMYRFHRKTYLDGKKRPRTTKRKGLIQFVRSHLELSWPDRLRLWNETHPADLQYSTDDNMQRDYKDREVAIGVR